MTQRRPIGYIAYRPTGLYAHWPCRRRRRSLRSVDHNSCSFSELLVLHSSVLEPDFDLSLSQVQLTGQMPALLTGDVSVVDELRLKDQSLETTVRFPLLPLS